MQAFKCPSCGGDIEYDIACESMKCVHCGNTVERAEYQKFLDANGLYVTKELQCPQCGATVLSYDDTIATFCSFCGASVSFAGRTVADVKPEAIVPFSVTAERALELYSDAVNKCAFAPEWLKESDSKKLCGIYMPYYVFESKADGRFTVNGQKRTTHGDTTTVEDYQITFDLDASYEGTRFDAATVFPDSMSETVDTFDLGGTKEFETSYLAGFYADGGIAEEDAYREIVDGLVTADLRSAGKKIEGIDLDCGDIGPKVDTVSRKVLLPVWLNTHRKDDRVCYSAVNGQNGNIAAEIPVDRKKYLFYAVIAAAITLIPLNLFFTFKPQIFLIISEILIMAFGVYLRKTAGNVYIRENDLDDVGKVGYGTFSKNAKQSPRGSSGSGSTRATASWTFSVPSSVRIKSWWKTLAGLAIVLGVMISGTVVDAVYYAAAVINIALAIWSAFDIIAAQNLLASRDIPVFTMKRGGDGLGK